MILHCRTLRSHRQQNEHCVPWNSWGSSKLRCYCLLSCAQVDPSITCGSSPSVPQTTASSLGSPVQIQTHWGKAHLFLRPFATILGTLLQDRDGRDHLWLFQITVWYLKCIQASAKSTGLSTATHTWGVCVCGGVGGTGECFLLSCWVFSRNPFSHFEGFPALVYSNWPLTRPSGTDVAIYHAAMHCSETQIKINWVY